MGGDPMTLFITLTAPQQASWLVGVAFVLFVVLYAVPRTRRAIMREFDTPRTLPGDLGRDNTWAELDEAERVREANAAMSWDELFDTFGGGAA